MNDGKSVVVSRAFKKIRGTIKPLTTLTLDGALPPSPGAVAWHEDFDPAVRILFVVEVPAGETAEAYVQSHQKELRERAAVYLKLAYPDFHIEE